MDRSYINPHGVAVDEAGNVYVADYYYNCIRKVSPAGVVSILAEGFWCPRGLAVDSAGNVYVADNHCIRKVSPAGVVTTLAGSIRKGFADGTGAAAQFSNPSGVAIDAAGNVYVADYDNNRIRVVSPAGVVTTLAGSTYGYADGTGASAQFREPADVALDAAGNVYVADEWNHRVRKVSPAGVVTTLPFLLEEKEDERVDLGDGSAIIFNAEGMFLASPSGLKVIIDLRGSKPPARAFKCPRGVTVDAAGNVYVADSGNHRICVISPEGEVTPFAGGVMGFANGYRLYEARFQYPEKVIITPKVTYILDQGNLAIRYIVRNNVYTMPS